MTSPLPPKRRDSRGIPDLIRQDRTRLGQLDRGLAFGKHPPLRPVRPNRDSDDVEDDLGDEPLYAWEWDDRYTATGPGNQRATLTYVPVDEALFVRWHPKGRGGVPLTNEHFVVSGRTVTILDPGLVAAGDQFSFQYQYDPDGEDTAPDAFTGLTFVGTTTYYGTTGSHPTSFALPAGTQVGDLIVLGEIGATSSSVTDGRLTNAATNVWNGRASDLSAVQVSAVGTYWAVMVSVFRVNTNPAATAQNVGSVSPFVAPIVAGSGGIAVLLGGYAIIDDLPGALSGTWLDVGSTGTGKCAARMAYWSDLSQSSTPAGSATSGPSLTYWSAATIGFGS